MIRNNPRSPFEPPRERGTWRAFALALVMHVLLGLFLYHGIQWQNSTPEGAEAELWTAVPDLSTPRPPAPPAPVTPAPPAPQVKNEDADIALQQKKRKQEEAAREAQLEAQQRLKQQQQEAEAKRQQQLAAQQAAELAAQKAAKLKQQQEQQAAEKLRQQQQQLADQKKQQQLQQQKEQQEKQAQLDAQKKADAAKAAKAKAEAQAKAQAEAQAKKVDEERRARIAQMQGLAGGGTSASGNGLGKNGTGSGSGGTAASAGYAEKVQRRVRPNIIWAGETQGLETVVSVRCAPDGALLASTIIRSSGNPQWDQAALRAVQHSDPMPLDTNGKAPSTFTITLRPAA